MMKFVRIASWWDVPKRIGFFERAESWRIESFIEHMCIIFGQGSCSISPEVPLGGYVKSF